jgi:hypothetical protein
MTPGRTAPGYPQAVAWLLLAALAALAAPAAARADGPPAPADPTAPVPVGFRLRVMPGFLTWTVVPSADSGILPSFLGVSAALEIQRRWSVELGSSHLPLFGGHNEETGADVFVRGGFTPKVGGRGGARSWTHHLLVYGGYRYLVLDLGNDAMHDAWPHHGLVANLGLETTRWFTRRVGISLRLLAGIDLLLRHATEPTQYGWRVLPTGPVEAAFGFDLGLDLGVAF